jgi:hypothetical protein
MNLIVLEEPSRSWDDFVSAHSDLIFHTSLWWRVLREGYTYPMRYLILEEEGRWLCALPGMIMGNRLIKIFYSLVPYGGFVGGKEHIPQFLNLLSRWARKEGIGRIQIIDLSIKKRRDLPDFKSVESYRHVLELKDKSADQIWKGYKDSLKRNIRMALNSHLRFENIKSKDQVEQLYKLYLDSMKRKKALIRYPIKLFRKIFDLLVPDFADMLFVKYQNQPVAGMVVIYSQQTAHYFHGGSDADYLHLRPNDLLFHNAIRTAAERGKSYFDFMGSGKHMVNLVRFKEKWGADKKVLPSYHKDISKTRVALYHLLLPAVNFFRGRR